MKLDKQASEEQARESARFLARLEEIERASQARLAASGGRPIKVLVGVDPLTGKVAVFPLPGPGQPPAERG